MFDNLFDNMDAFVNYVKANDSKRLRDRLLLTDRLRYYYCLHIKDRKGVWCRITSSFWAYMYCLHVKDRKGVWSNITESEWAYGYCRDIKNRSEVSQHISGVYLDTYKSWGRVKL